ncbi:MAG: ABC transporter permease [Spirochaetota bacterium]
MSFYLKMAWRNIFRNRRRTFLTGLIIGIGLASIMFTDALVVGMKENMIKSATASFIGDAQIHREGFQDTFNSQKTIRGRRDLIEKIQADEQIENFTQRTASWGTVSSPSDIQSIMLYGIKPETEQTISRIDEAVVEGEFLSGMENGAMGEVLIGTKLAERLEADVGDRIILSVTDAHSDEIVQNMFRVAGIYGMQIDDMDSSMAFVPLETAQQMLGIDDEVHEIAVKFTDISYAVSHEESFAKDYSLHRNIAQTWPQLMPQMKHMLEMTDFSVGIALIIVFVVIVFGIINTLFMSLYERLFEFGVMRAVGTRSTHLRRLIVFEAGSLSVYASIIGIILGTLLILFGSLKGFNLSGIEFAGTTFTEEIYTVYRLRQFVLYPVLIMLFTTVVSLYPARYASRMSVSHALRKTM